MLRFAVVTFVSALIILTADNWAGQWFFELGSLLAARETTQLLIANYAYKAFTWACLFLGVLAVSPERSHNWSNAVVCSLVLAVALYQARELSIWTVANGQTTVVWWIASLMIFTLPAFLILEWYRRAVRAHLT